MAYGKPKITSTEIKEEILKEISDAIDRNSDFTGDNLAFYGYNCQFEVNLILQARGPESGINIIGGNSREQQLEPGEAPPLTRRQYIEQWLTNMEAHGEDVNADTLSDFIEHLPTDEPAPVAELVKAKGKKARGATRKGD